MEESREGQLGVWKSGCPGPGTSTGCRNPYMYRTESCGRRARRARTRRGGPAAPAAVLCHACLGSVGQGGHSAQCALVMTSQRPAASTFIIDWTWEHWGEKVPVGMYQH